MPWTANDAGSRIGLSSGYNVQIGVDTQLAVHYDGGVNVRLKQLEATYLDSYGSGTPAASHWRAGYDFGDAADGNLLAHLPRQRVDKEGVADPAGRFFAPQTLPDHLPSVTSHPRRETTAACTPNSFSSTVNLDEPFCRNSQTDPISPFPKPADAISMHEFYETICQEFSPDPFYSAKQTK